MSNITIGIAAEFKGKKAFNDASKATTALEKGVAKLGKQLLGVFAVSKVVAFGKASLKAFTEDEAAAARLASTVKNLGLAFAQPEIDRYVQKLEASSAVADDSLRPALQALLTTTGSLSESQKILNIAIEASRATGKDLTTVAQDLGQAYVGNTRGLRKYNLGLTQAELKTISFTEVQARFAKQFTGANAAFLDTYAGRLQVVTVAAGNAQETIGKGLVDALALAGGKDGDIQDVADAMQNLATFTADSIRGVGVLAGKLQDLNSKSGGNLGEIFDALTLYNPLRMLANLGKESRPRPRANRNFMGGSGGNLYDADVARQSKIDKERARLAKAQLDAQRKQTAELKRQALTKKQSALFDLEQIQLIAAMQGKLTKEERTRAELQLALLTGNTVEADKLSYRLAMSIDSTGALAKSLRDLPDANNPFKNWDAYLDGLLVKARLVAGLGTGGTGGGTGGGGAAIINIPAGNASTVESPLRGLDTGAIAQLLQGGYRVTDRDGGGQQIIVQIDGKAVATAVQNQSLSGNDPAVNRLLGGFK